MAGVGLWQCCPVCHGQGLMNKPSWVAGDQDSWGGMGVGPYECRVCEGTGMVVTPNGTMTWDEWWILGRTMGWIREYGEMFGVVNTPPGKS